MLEYPVDVAKKLTIPETVSQWNLERLKELVMNGPNTYPGANYIIRPDGVKIRLDYVTDRKAIADSLALGYIVERHLADDDIVIFNRKPHSTECQSWPTASRCYHTAHSGSILRSVRHTTLTLTETK